MRAIIPHQLKKNATQKWQTFCSAATNHLPLSTKDSQRLDSLQTVFGFSNFISKNCIQSPQIPIDLIKSSDLESTYPENRYADMLEKLFEKAGDQRELPESLTIKLLRQFRRREMIRIAWRDLGGLADLTGTMTDLSRLARACIQQTYTLLYEKYCQKFGTPLGENQLPQHLIVLGMGKLGAEELNFSSDIDLIFAFGENGQTSDKSKPITNTEFFTRLCRDLVKIIGQNTLDGFVFRMDTRLRPFGENGPLVMSFDGMEEYYQRQGREWERYALVKARVVAGDLVAGQNLLNRLKPFIYRRYLDFGAFESLRKMKQMISLEVKRRGLKNNIKLGPGGIREIEFFGQMFQLIRGGVFPKLQQPAIQPVLKVLADENYIDSDVAKQLEQAYIFLRNTEHRLQEFDDSQTHELPLDKFAQSRLAGAMGFKEWIFYEKALKNHLNNVHYHFNALMASNEPADPDTLQDNYLEEVWQNNNLESSEIKDILSQAGYINSDKTGALLCDYKTEPVTKSLSKKGRDRLNRLMPLILKQVAKTDQPDIVLNRIIDLLRTIQRRTSYLALLLEYPVSLNHLIKLCSASPWIASFLSKHPVLLDELLDPRSLYSIPIKQDLVKDLDRRLNNFSSEEFEYQMDELRIFKQVNVLKIAASDITDILPLMKVSDRLTDIAEVILAAAINLAWEYLIAKHGRPVTVLNEKADEKGFAVIAYGKMGGLELGYGSDLDLVFLHAAEKGHTRGKDKPIDNTQFFARLGQRVIHILSTHTSTGSLYETDMRLRPSGQAGVLVSHIDAFEKYQVKQAWTWEHQALIRARAVAGSALMKKRFTEIRQKILTLPRDKAALRSEVAKMRMRMKKEQQILDAGQFDLKQGDGGLVDIEFLIQYLVLLNAHQSSKMLQWTDNVRLLQSLADAGILPEQTAHFLKHTYLLYRSACHRLNLNQKPAVVSSAHFQFVRNQVKKIWEIRLGPKE